MDRVAFEQAAMEHLDSVYGMALSLTKKPELAEDLTQDVFVRAFQPRAVAGFEAKGGGMRSWLLAITHNVFYTSLKKNRRIPIPVGEFFEASSNEREPDAPPPAWDQASLDWEHVDDKLKAAIDDLKPGYRQVLLMWGVDGLKYREIAAILEVPIGTVMSRLHRARKTVADALTASPGDAGDALGSEAQGREDSP